MLLRKNLDNRLLFVLGSGLTALRIVLQNLLDRAGKSNDFTDFLMGLLLGVGLGCLILFTWRLSRPNRSNSTGSRTS
jgi:NhaP-type Na+/H+ or K+/H+ antiporter